MCPLLEWAYICTYCVVPETKSRGQRTLLSVIGPWLFPDLTYTTQYIHTTARKKKKKKKRRIHHAVDDDVPDICVSTVVCVCGSE